MLAAATVMQTRHGYREGLKALEDQTLGALDLVATQVSRALDAVVYQDVELAGIVVAADRGIDRCYLDLHGRAVALLARQAPVAGDLRLVAAVLQVIRCIERMGEQCVNIAKLVPLSGYESPKDKEILDGVERMGALAHGQITQVKEALRARHVLLARDLARQDEEINRLNRDVLRRAVAIGDDPEVREWTMFMILVARCVERIGDNTVDIGEQVAFIVTGLFRGIRPMSSR